MGTIETRESDLQEVETCRTKGDTLEYNNLTGLKPIESVSIPNSVSMGRSEVPENFHS